MSQSLRTCEVYGDCWGNFFIPYEHLSNCLWLGKVSRCDRGAFSDNIVFTMEMNGEDLGGQRGFFDDLSPIDHSISRGCIILNF